MVRLILAIPSTGSRRNWWDTGESCITPSDKSNFPIKGDLKPDCTYVIEVRPYMRAVMAGVRLIQISPTDHRALKKIGELIDKIQPAELKGQEEDLTSFIENGMARYGNIENKVEELNPNWTF